MGGRFKPPEEFRIPTAAADERAHHIDSVTGRQARDVYTDPDTGWRAPTSPDAPTPEIDVAGMTHPAEEYSTPIAGREPGTHMETSRLPNGRMSSTIQLGGTGRAAAGEPPMHASVPVPTEVLPPAAEPVDLIPGATGGRLRSEERFAEAHGAGSGPPVDLEPNPVALPPPPPPPKKYRAPRGQPVIPGQPPVIPPQFPAPAGVGPGPGVPGAMLPGAATPTPKITNVPQPTFITG